MTVTNVPNSKSVKDFAVYIQTRSQEINKNWFQIAEAFAEAKDMFGSGSSAFKELAKITRYSQSSISKLISIVNSDRLKRYAVQFSSVQGWSTLYAITILTDEQFDRFLRHLNISDTDQIAQFITIGDVNRFRKEAREKSFFRGYAVVQVDDEAVKGGLLSGSEFELLQKLLAEIETISSYVVIKRAVLSDKEELSRLTRIEDKVQQLIRRRYQEVINARLAKYSKHKGEHSTDHEVRALGKNREELKLDFDINPAEVLAYLGIEYDLATFYRDAERDVNAAEFQREERYAKKVLSRPPVVEKPELDSNAGEEGWEELRAQKSAQKAKEAAARERRLKAFENAI